MNNIKQEKLLSVTQLLLRCINNYIYCKIIEEFSAKNSFFVGNSCGINTHQGNAGGIITPIVESLKCDFITLSYTLFFAKKNEDVLFRTKKLTDDPEYKKIQKLVEIQRHNITAHIHHPDIKIKNDPEFINFLAGNNFMNRYDSIGSIKANEEETKIHFGGFIDHRKQEIGNSSVDYYAEVKMAKTEEEKDHARKEIKESLRKKIDNSSYMLRYDQNIISVVLKLYDEFYEENKKLLTVNLGNETVHKQEFFYPLLSKKESVNSDEYEFYLDRFFSSKEKVKSSCFVILRMLHRSMLAKSISNSVEFDED